MFKFSGYPRPDGSVGIRNHVVILPSIGCVNGTVDRIAKMVPGTVPLFHGHGCGRNSVDVITAFRTLVNLGKNANVAAVLVVGLGCEYIMGDKLCEAIRESGKPVELVMVQKDGGSIKTAEKGAAIARKMLADAAKIEKKEFGLDKIILALECGGSDALSGITANPATGKTTDWLIENGGSALLTEATEMIGTTHIMKAHAASKEIGEEVEKAINDQEKIVREILGPIADAIISPGNMEGGMSSIQEKSLGCICKAGQSPINGVIDYAEIPKGKGLYLMKGPAYDPDSMTGLVAAGAQIMIFTTGRGTPIGFPICPVIKVASNSNLYNAMEDDMDINAGKIVEGATIDELGQELTDLVKRVIQGEKPKAEVNQQDRSIFIFTTLPSL